MTPSIEIREEAAKLHASATEAEDAAIHWEDAGDPAAVLWSRQVTALVMEEYKSFCRRHGFELLTDASGLFLRCAETQIPLCDTDECIETETGQLMRVKQAA